MWIFLSVVVILTFVEIGGGGGGGEVAKNKLSKRIIILKKKAKICILGLVRAGQSIPKYARAD